MKGKYQSNNFFKIKWIIVTHNTTSCCNVEQSMQQLDMMLLYFTVKVMGHKAGMFKPSLALLLHRDINHMETLKKRGLPDFKVMRS